jgi:hypothetical protein
MNIVWNRAICFLVTPALGLLNAGVTKNGKKVFKQANEAKTSGVKYRTGFLMTVG